MVRAAGGVGLTGIIIIAGALYYTGMGGVVLDKMQDFNGQCPGLFPYAVRAVGDPVCRVVDYSVEGITKLCEMAQQAIEGVEQQARDMFASSFEGLGSLGESLEQAVAGLASPAERLSQLALSGPGGLEMARGAEQQLQQAIDSFSIGQRYLAQGSNASAVPWLMHGAQQPSGYGLLSQLSLGDMYRNGSHGIAMDPMRAQAYYQQAANSLVLLNQSNTPQAQQLLQTLPVSPQVLQQQLLQTISQIKGQSGR